MDQYNEIEQASKATKAVKDLELEACNAQLAAVKLELAAHESGEMCFGLQRFIKHLQEELRMCYERLDMMPALINENERLKAENTALRTRQKPVTLSASESELELQSALRAPAKQSGSS